MIVVRTTGHYFKFFNLNEVFVKHCFRTELLKLQLTVILHSKHFCSKACQTIIISNGGTDIFMITHYRTVIFQYLMSKLGFEVTLQNCNRTHDAPKILLLTVSTHFLCELS